MNKLLHANFARLIRNKPFWIGTLFMLAMGILFPLVSYFNMMDDGYTRFLDSSFLNCAFFIQIVSSVFCGFFIGTEYSDGTVRNKIITGQKRSAIYLDNLIVCAAAGLFMCLVYFLAHLAVGLPLLGSFRTDLTTVLLFVLCTLVLSLALTGIYTLAAMLIQSKAISSVVCILTAFLFLVAGTYINARLSEPEAYPIYTYSSDEGLGEEKMEPNPRYLRGTERKVYEFLYDVLPGGQTVQCTSAESDHPQLLMAYSGLIFLASGGIGLIFFQKKDLK